MMLLHSYRCRVREPVFNFAVVAPDEDEAIEIAYGMLEAITKAERFYSSHELEFTLEFEHYIMREQEEL